LSKDIYYSIISFFTGLLQPSDPQRCDVPCSATLECGHLCSGTCGQCLQGRFHIPCVQDCLRTLVCGHRCVASETKVIQYRHRLYIYRPIYLYKYDYIKLYFSFVFNSWGHISEKRVISTIFHYFHWSNDIWSNKNLYRYYLFYWSIWKKYHY
jgi:hypothetical protein